jgi:hypothetical protein
LPAAFILQRDTGDSPRQPLADQPRNPESRVLVAKSGAVNVGDTIAFGIAETNSRGEGQISTKTVWRGQARPLADQHDNHVRSEDRADFVAERDPRAGRDHGMADFNPIGGQAPNEAPYNRYRVGVDCHRRQAIADDKCKLAGPAATACQQLLRRPIECSSEVGALEILLSVGRSAEDPDRPHAEPGKTGGHSGNIESSMNRVAGSCVR